MKHVFKQVTALMLVLLLSLPLLASCGSRKAESEQSAAEEEASLVTVVNGVTVTKEGGIPIYEKYKSRKVDLGLADTEKVFDVVEIDGQLRVTVGILDPNYDPEEENGYHFWGVPFPTEHRWYSLDYVEDVSKREKTAIHQEITFPSDPDLEYALGGEPAEEEWSRKVMHGVIYHIFKNGERIEDGGKLRPYNQEFVLDFENEPDGYNDVAQLMVCDDVTYLNLILVGYDPEKIATINNDGTGVYEAFLFINGRVVDRWNWVPGDPYYSYEGLIGIGGKPYALLNIEDKGRLAPLTPETTELPCEGVDIEGLPTGGAFTDGCFGYFMSNSELWRTDGVESHCIAELAPHGVDVTSSVRSVRALSNGRILVSADGKLIELTESTGNDAIPVCDIGVLDYDAGIGSFADFNLLVSKYNSQAEDFYIRAKEYRDVGKLNLAMLSGDVDMVVTSNQSALKNYIKQDIFVPLEEVAPALFEKDTLIESVVNASKVDGVCYYLPVNFDVCGEYIADPGLLKDGTVLEDRVAYYEFIKKNDPEYFKSHTNFQILNNFAVDLDEWIDWEANTCHFDDGTFAPLLEFSALGCTEEERIEREAAENTLETWWGHDEKAGSFTLADGVESYRFTDMAEAKKYQKGLPKADNQVGGPTTWVYLDFPMPSRVHKGYAIDPHNLYAIVDHEDTNAACGDFLRWLILDDVVEEFPEKESDDYHARGWDGFSINKDETDRFLKRLIDGYVDPKDEEATINPDVAAQYPSIVAEIRYGVQRYDARCGQTQYEITWEYIHKADHLRYTDSELLRVIHNEAQGFFSGSITAEKAADYIQNRISLYLAEQS